MEHTFKQRKTLKPQFVIIIIYNNILKVITSFKKLSKILFNILISDFSDFIFKTHRLVVSSFDCWFKGTVEKSCPAAIPVAKQSLIVDNYLLFMMSKFSSVNARTKMIHPSESTTLSTPIQSC